MTAESDVGFGSLLVVLLYVVLFFAIGRVMANDYLKEEPVEALKEEIINTKNVDPNFFMERYRDIIRHGERGEQISFTLCGFAILALVFLFTLFKDELVSVEWVIALFSLAFIFEILSAFSYHGTKTNASTFGGMVFQYAGLFAMLLGFLNYVSSAMSWSFAVVTIYLVGVVVFVVITYSELTIYAEYSRALDKKEDE